MALNQISNKKNPLVSIIMNCHNSDKFVEEAIKSVIDQSYSNWELIFWDNNSSDNSRKKVETFKDKRIKYFFNNEYTALGQARNLAINQSSGELIAFLDCDDLWMPRKLDLQIPKFDDLDVGIVISNTIFFNSNKKEKVLYKKKPKEGYVFKELLEDYFISLETVMIRKSELQKLNEWFDERFEVIEEFDLFIRLSKNCKLAYVDQILGKWRVHESSWTWSRRELFPKEKKIFIEKVTKEFPKLKQKYKRSFDKLSFDIKIEEFILDWRKNNKANQKKISGIIRFSRKALILYWISKFIPYSVFNYLKNKKDLLLN